MDLDSKIKEYIDGLTYKELLQRWRFAPLCDTIFQGESGKYWNRRMKDLYPSDEEHTRISKEIGWGQP